MTRTQDVPVQYQRLDVGSEFVQSNIVLHQSEHFVLVGEEQRRLMHALVAIGHGPIGDSQANETSASTELQSGQYESAKCFLSVVHRSPGPLLFWRVIDRWGSVCGWLYSHSRVAHFLPVVSKHVLGEHHASRPCLTATAGSEVFVKLQRRRKQTRYVKVGCLCRLVRR